MAVKKKKIRLLKRLGKWLSAAVKLSAPAPAPAPAPVAEPEPAPVVEATEQE